MAADIEMAKRNAAARLAYALRLARFAAAAPRPARTAAASTLSPNELRIRVRRSLRTIRG